MEIACCHCVGFSFVYFSFPSHSKDMHNRLNGESKLDLSLSVCPVLDWQPVHCVFLFLTQKGPVTLNRIKERFQPHDLQNGKQ